MPIIILPSGGNDTAALQAADIQAQQAGTYLSLGPGTFNVVPGLVAHVPWIGTSKYLTSIKAINSSWSFGTPLIALTSNAILALMTIDTSLAIYGSYNYPTINASGAINWGIKHCNFTGIKSPAISIYAGNVSNFKISDNDFSMPNPVHTFNQAINLSIGEGATFKGAINNNNLKGLGMDLAGTDIDVIGNWIDGCAFGGGITVQPLVGCSGFNISYNRCINGVGLDVNNTYPSGIEFWGSNSVLNGNICRNNSGFGIVVGNSGNTITGNQCLSNGVSAKPSAGIILYSIPGSSACNNTISGNTCTGSPQNYGIIINAQAAPITGNIYGDNNLTGNTIGASNVALT